jgi:hypothetical protein
MAAVRTEFMAKGYYCTDGRQAGSIQCVRPECQSARDQEYDHL